MLNSAVVYRAAATVLLEAAVVDPQTVEKPKGEIGGGLASALDVMAFTHDLDLTGGSTVGKFTSEKSVP